MLQVEGVIDVEASTALETGTLIVAADPNTLTRNLMEAIRRLVSLAAESNAVRKARASTSLLSKEVWEMKLWEIKL